MPIYKYKRTDIIRSEELNEILDRASQINRYDLSGESWQCLIAIMWLFGKRISEIICLKSNAVSVDETHLNVLFMVLKKESQKDNGILKPFKKRVILENPYTDYVIKRWKKVNGFLFPRIQTKTGHIYREYAHNVLKDISPKISSHYFRHSLATQMAESGATAYELVNWFDWDRMDTALGYIKRSGRMTEKLSNRKW